MQPVPLQISSDVRDGNAHIAVLGELDIASAPRLEEATETMLAQGASRVVIDLSELAFIDSSGLRLLIALSDRADADGWALALVRPPEPCFSVFRITGADENLPFVAEDAD